ncbi:hypothetical protein BDW59DRAFT_162512 [Aspergillus cavernicola]|uniref:Aminoglycoside phosphotransferase domain-containing protein n=1 Tax=Aspergillus cavernicola TaxID=176166 RepID=A0ABR4I9L4_9EURO
MPKGLGPFIGEADFVSALVANYRVDVEHNKRPEYKVRFYETYLGQVLKGHRPTLTHGDAQQKNIMVVEKNTDRNEQGGRAFDFFGASSFFSVSYWEEDWRWRAQQFLDVWPAELSILQIVEKDLRGFKALGYLTPTCQQRQN